MPLNAAIGQVLHPIVAIGQAYLGFFEFFHRQLAQKGRRLMLMPPFSIRVLHIK